MIQDSPQFGHQKRIKKLVIASSLKPADDVRQFEKVARVLSPLTEVSYCFGRGYDGGSVQLADAWGVTLVDHKVRGTGILSRLRMMAKYAFFLAQVRPELIIASCSEFQLINVLYKILFGATLSVDVQENFAKNVLFNPSVPQFLRPLLAQLLEKYVALCAPWQAIYIIAEPVYPSQMPHILPEKHVLFMNKVSPPPYPIVREQRGDGKIRLLFTGSISAHFGIWRALSWAEQLHAIDPRFELQILGYTPIWALAQQVIAHIASQPWVHAEIASDAPIPHHRIWQAISQADIGLLPYLPNEATNGRIPTKLFEYQYIGLPMLMSEEYDWSPYLGDKAKILKTKGILNVSLVNELVSLANSDLSPHNEQFCIDNDAKKLVFVFSKVI